MSKRETNRRSSNTRRQRLYTDYLRNRPYLADFSATPTNTRSSIVFLLPRILPSGIGEQSMGFLGFSIIIQQVISACCVFLITTTNTAAREAMITCSLATNKPASWVRCKCECDDVITQYKHRQIQQQTDSPPPTSFHPSSSREALRVGSERLVCPSSTLSFVYVASESLRERTIRPRSLAPPRDSIPQTSSAENAFHL
ncbi:hypothetical protein LX36DRAFT_414144 [Colletotrichum falcatum]|nr:hypothetical protein LX36DRAFT_414144 [Colletotrichum falcatum]